MVRQQHGQAGFAALLAAASDGQTQNEQASGTGAPVYRSSKLKPDRETARRTREPPASKPAAPRS